MKFHLLYLIVIFLFLNTSCSKEKEKISIIEEENSIAYINKALDYGFYVEIDLYFIVVNLSCNKNLFAFIHILLID